MLDNGVALDNSHVGVKAVSMGAWRRARGKVQLASLCGMGLGCSVVRYDQPSRCGCPHIVPSHMRMLMWTV